MDLDRRVNARNGIPFNKDVIEIGIGNTLDADALSRRGDIE